MNTTHLFFRTAIIDTLLDLLIQLPDKIPVIADNVFFYIELIDAITTGYNSLLRVINVNDDEDSKRMEALQELINTKLIKIGNVVRSNLIHRSGWQRIGPENIGHELRV